MAAKSGGYISVEGAVSGTQSARTTEVTSTTPSFTFQTYTTTCNVMVVGGGGSGPVGQGGSGIVVVHEPATPFSLIRGIWNIQGQYVQKKAGTWT